MVLLLHITDIHLNEQETILERQVDSTAQMVYKHKPNQIIILIGGDLVQSGSYKEYKNFEIFLEKLVSLIEFKTKINPVVFFTPGNHDLKYWPGEKRTRQDILNLTQNDITNNYNDESRRLKDFNEFVNKVYENQKSASIEEIESDDAIFYRHFQILTEDSIILDVVCFNNAMFSFYDRDDKLYDNDSGALRICLDKVNKLSRKGNFSVLLMHYPLEFFEYYSKTKLQFRIDRQFDFVFTGHIHTEEVYQKIKRDRKVTYFRTGEYHNHNNNESTFNVALLDNNVIEVINYKWQNEHNYYLEEKTYNEKIRTRNISVDDLLFRSDFDSEFTNDTANLKDSILDCFIFPTIISSNIYDDSEQQRINDLESFIDIIEHYDYAVIEGDDGSGKTTIIKQLFKEFAKNYIVIYVDESTITKNKSSRRIIEEIFMKQYDAHSVDQFFNYDISRRILLIDNIENNKKTLDSLKQEFSKTIITTSRNYKKTIISNLKNELESEESGVILEIKGFYKSKRTELATKLYKTLNKSRGKKITDKDITKFKKKFNSVVDTHLTIFGVNPFMINLLVQHLCENQTAEEKNIYNDVFHSNLTRTIKASAEHYESREYNFIVTALQKVAFFMHQNNLSTIDETNIIGVLKDYNTKFRQSIKYRDFIDILSHAKIFKETEDNKFYFSSKNFYAYYVSKEFIYLMNKIPIHDSVFTNLFDNIFNEINDKILLFLAFAQQNDRIINHIADKAVEFFGKQEEIKIEDLKILSTLAKESKDLIMISNEDRNKYIEGVEKNEEKVMNKEKETTVNVFGKNFTDRERDFYAFNNYIDLIGTILPNFTHMLEEETQLRLANLVYKLPNQMLYWFLKDLDENVDEIYNLLKKAVLKSGKANEDDANKIATQVMLMFQQIISQLIVAVYSELGSIVMDYSTESLIVDSGFESSLTRRIQNIIFRSHSLKDTDFYKFKEAIVKEYDKAEKDKHIVVKNILKIVVNEFLIRNDAPKDFHGRNQRFFETFYGKEALEKFRELNNKNED